MKRIKLIICLLLSAAQLSLYAQAVQNHATGRSAFTDAKNVMSDNAILLYYFGSDNDRTNFLARYGFQSTDLPAITAATAQKNDMAGAQAGNDAAVLSDPKMGIDALGTFVANRFKQEINIAFLNKFKADLNTIPHLDLLFPESKKVLAAGDPYNYPVFLETLRQAFTEDVNNLPRTLPKIIPRLDPANAELIAHSTILLKIIADPNTPATIVTTLNELATNLPAATDPALKLSVYALAFTVNAMYNSEGTGAEMFIKGTEAEFADAAFRKRYLALLIRQNEMYLSAAKINISQAADLEKITKLINNLVPVYNTLARQVGTLSSANKQGRVTPQLVQESFTVLINALKDAVAAYADSNLDPGFDKTKLDAIIVEAETINNTARLIIEKKYGLALLNVVNFVDNLAKTKLTPEQRVKVNRYMGFITNVLSAESKDDLVQALETSANPVGSYRVKRNSTFNISLNAYAGAFYGSDFGDSQVFGFTTPIGIYMGWGNLGKKDAEVLSSDKGASIGLLFSLIDIGAVTAFRLKDDKTELADVSWSNVFAPGTYLSIGLPKCPVSINLGGQVGPEVTSIDASGVAVLEKNQWHWRAAITVDIPFFDLHTKQKALK